MFRAALDRPSESDWKGECNLSLSARILLDDDADSRRTDGLSLPPSRRCHVKGERSLRPPLETVDPGVRRAGARPVSSGRAGGRWLV